MNIITDVARELIGMFLGDWKLSTAVLILVGIVAGLVLELHAAPLLAGAILLVGCLAILAGAVILETRNRSVP